MSRTEQNGAKKTQRKIEEKLLNIDLLTQAREKK